MGASREDDDSDAAAATAEASAAGELARLRRENDALRAELAALGAEQEALLGRAAVEDRLASLGRLAVGISNELNNPLGWVITNLYHVHRQLGPGAASDELRAAIEDALDGTARLSRIVEDLRSGADAQPLDPIGAEVGPTALAALRMTAHALPPRTIVELDVAPGLPRALADPARLGQVLTNLVMNAARALGERGAPGGKLRVEAHGQGDAVVIRVVDDAPGMDEDARMRAFEPFAGSDAARGTGLDLWISRRIVESFGGTLELESAPERGTASVLTLRRATAAPKSARPPAHPSAPPSSARLRVLVIDDEPLIGRALRRTLSQHHVVYEERGEDALARILEGEEFDVVLCDLTMPGGDGLRVLDAIREAAPHLASRMVLMTGGATTETLAEIAARGLPLIDKPFEPAVLAAALRRAAGVEE